jgi:hypothetical protein
MESSTPDSELVFRMVASLLFVNAQLWAEIRGAVPTFHVVILFSFPIGVRQVRIQDNERCSETCS